jgi:hypothetical protein
VIEFLTASEGSLYTHLLPGFWTWFGVEEESLGTWEVFDIVFPSGSYVVAPGELAVFSFRALADGHSPIHFLSVSVKDIDRYPLDPLEWEDGCVYVGPFSSVVLEEDASSQWRLGSPVPNPFRTETSVWFTRPSESCPGDCRLGIYDVRGRLVRGLLGETEQSGEIVWNGRSDRDVTLPSGVYFFRLETSREVLCRKVILAR